MIIIAVLILLAIGLRLAIPGMGASVAGGVVTDNGQQSLADCPGTPNCQRDTLTIGGEPSQAIRTMATLIGENSHTQIVTQDEQYLHATWSSPIMGFIDDVEFLLVQPENGEQPVLQVRSASRLGKSDLGANAARIDTLRNDSQGRL